MRAPPLLGFVKTVAVEPTRTPCIGAGHSIENTAAGAAKISWWMDDNFKQWFLDKIEEPIGGTTLRCHLLQDYATDLSIIAELGGEAKVGTTLTEVPLLDLCD